MSVTITYRSLFSVDVWHHFFLDDETGNFIGFGQGKRNKILQSYNLSDFLRIQPTENTRKILRDHQLIFKNTPTGFLISGKADPFDVSKIFNPLSENQVLRFVISTSDSSFQNYTNNQNNSTSLYYFNNYDHIDSEYSGLSQWPAVFDSLLASSMESDGNPDTFAYPAGSMLVDALPNPNILKIALESTNDNFTDNSKWKKDLPANSYDAGATYQMGDRVLFTQAGIDSIYEAKEETSGNAPTDTSKWAKIKDLPLQYANENDLLPRLGELFSFTIPTVGSTIRFDVHDALDNIILSKTRTSEKDLELHQLDLSMLPSGKLIIRVIDDTTDTIIQEDTGIILRPFDIHEKPVALVEIMAEPIAGSYKLIDGSDNFLNPAYAIRFKNRSTVWQYYDDSEHLVTSSPEPKPLLFRGYQKITHDGRDLPNPEVKMIRPTPRQTYSEIFI